MQKGFQSLAGFKKASVWGTAVACGALDGFLYNSIGGKPSRDVIEDQSMGAGRRTAFPGYAGNYKLAPTLDMNLRYGGYNVKRFLAGLMGTAGSPSTVDTSGKKHTLVMAQDLAGLFFTLAFELDKDTEVHEYTTVKLVRMALSGQIGQALKLTFSLAAHGFNQNAGSGTNTTTTIDTVTLGTDGTEEVLMSQVQLLVNDQTAADFTLPSFPTLNSALVVEGFELTFDPKLRVGKYNTQFGSNEAEPIQEDHTDIRLNLKFSEYGAGNRGNQVVVDQLAKTLKKAKLTATSPNLAGAATQKYQHVLWMPMLQYWDGAPELTDKGEPKWDATMKCHEVATAPTGFTYTKALTWEVFDKDTVDPIA